jgi:hypothetical protein
MPALSPLLVCQLRLIPPDPCYDPDGCYRLVLELLRRVVQESHWDGCTKAKAARNYIFLSQDFVGWCTLVRLDVEVVREQTTSYQNEENGDTI